MLATREKLFIYQEDVFAGSNTRSCRY